MVVVYGPLSLILAVGLIGMFCLLIVMILLDVIGWVDGFQEEQATRSSGGEWQFCPLCSWRLIMGNVEGKKLLKCSRCSFIHWNNPKPVSVIVIPSTGGGLVLVKRKVNPKAGFWALPGGFVNEGEGPETAARREALEETRVEIEIERLLLIFKPENANQILHFYLAKPTDQIPHAGDDASEALIVPVDQIPKDIAFSSHAQVIEQWLKETGQR